VRNRLCGASTAPILHCEGMEDKHACSYPKDGELYLSRVKSGETLMEARSGTDVQIVRQTWSKGTAK